MKFHLSIINIETEPKKGFYLVFNKSLYKVSDIDLNNKGKEVTVNNVLSDNIEYCSHIDYNVAKVNVAKFIATVKDKTYSIVNGDFDVIVNSLKESVDNENVEFKTLLECCLNDIPIMYKGLFDYYKTRITRGDNVKISSLYLVDKFKLYDFNLRNATILDYNSRDGKFKIKTDKQNIEIICRRDDIEPLTKSNVFIMVKILCPYCNK